MDSAKQQLADRLKSANNILVTVSRDPSVDQLSACLGLTLLLNKLNKHSVAVFSGQVPSTIEFLKPEETIEKNTDSLRDFIIALDKSKADKLRYKVEDNVVRIFITPYKTSISQEDLEFSQGDFNVDVVVALGVKQQQDLDEAITAHGRILHDATVASINLGGDTGLGTIIWQDPQASSLSELVTDLAGMLGENTLDNQIATALLTGIVAETDRFSNDKTSSQTMTASSALMAAGANQQLVASKLEEPASQPKDDKPSGNDDDKADKNAARQAEDGTLSIEHDKSAETKPSEDDKDGKKNDKKPDEKPAVPPELPAPQLNEDKPADTPDEDQPPAADHVSAGPQLMTEPPKLGGDLTANAKPEALDPITDPLSLPSAEAPLLDRSPKPAPEPAAPSVAPTPPQPPSPSAPASTPVWTPPEPAIQPPKPSETPPTPSPAPDATPVFTSPAAGQSQTLTEIEQSVNSPHVDPAKLDSARDEIKKALNDSPTPPAPTPIQALNAQPLGEDLRPPAPAPPPPPVQLPNKPVMPLGPTPSASADTNPTPAPQVTNPNAPPPVAPPMPFQFGAANPGTPTQPTPPNQSKPPL